MRAIASWLARLRTPSPDDLAEFLFRVFVPGRNSLDIDKWLIATCPQGEVKQFPRAGPPEAMSVIRLLDHKEAGRSLFEQQRLSTELAALFSLALDRRVDIPLEVAVRFEGSDRVMFTPYAQIVDRTVLGPIPTDSQSSIAQLLSRIPSLTELDQATLGDAASLLHAAMLLFDREVRAAYTLLIAGLEVLSRAYGQPPNAWEAWEDHADWNSLFSELALSGEQGEHIRTRLMENRHLRLRATFRAYGAERMPDSFWQGSYDEWMYPIDATNGMPMDASLVRQRRIRDVLPMDRHGLSKALALSYDLRSRFVHQGHWLGPIDLTLLHDGVVAFDKPLPFNILSQMLAELLRLEMETRSSLSELPDIQVFRGVPSDVASQETPPK